ncbi:MAG: hypothetical protein AAFQ21_13675 [Pseudomonadota bacterium]
MNRALFAALSAFALAGCASTAVYDERESLLAEPVDCTVAEEDIAALEGAMPSRGERALSVVQTVTPIGAASGVVRGSYRDRAAVLTGRTKGELSARIEEIRQTCGLEQTDATEAATTE